MSSNTPDLSVRRSLDLIGQLHRTVTDFAAREEQLVRDLRSRRAGIDRKLRDGLARNESRQQEQSAKRPMPRPCCGSR